MKFELIETDDNNLLTSLGISAEREKVLTSKSAEVIGKLLLGNDDYGKHTALQELSAVCETPQEIAWINMRTWTYNAAVMDKLQGVNGRISDNRFPTSPSEILSMLKRARQMAQG